MQEKGQKRQAQGARKNGKGKKGPTRAVGFLKAPSLYPARRVGTLAYDAVFNLSPAASASAYNTFRANSVFDPDFSGAGTTASGYTQLAAVYGRYRVLKADVECIWNNTTALPGMAFLIASPANTVGTSFTQIMAQKFAWCKQLGNVNGPHVAHKVNFKMSTIYGTTEAAVLSEDDFAGLIGTNPNNVIFLHIGVTNATGTAFATAVFLQVRIMYTVEWSLPLLTAT